MKSRFWQFFQDVDGSFSFKRLQGGVFMLLFVAVVICNLCKVMLSESVLNLFTFLITYNTSGVVIERFSKRGTAPVTKDDPEVRAEEVKEQQPPQ